MIEVKKTEQWLKGYEDGVWAQTFPEEFQADPVLSSNQEYKAGYEQGFTDSKDSG